MVSNRSRRKKYSVPPKISSLSTTKTGPDTAKVFSLLVYIYDGFLMVFFLRYVLNPHGSGLDLFVVKSLPHGLTLLLFRYFGN